MNKLPEHQAVFLELQSILYELSRPAQPSDMSHRMQLCQRALILVERTAQPPLWASLQGELGYSLAHSMLGDRAGNLEQAIEHYECALEVFTWEAFPAEWATTQHNLAIAYTNRIRGNRAENLEHAISYHEHALKVYTQGAFPEQWVAVHSNLATVYAQRIHGNLAGNLEHAIAHCRQALKLCTRRAFPEQWARTNHNLANIYADRVVGDRSENIERAIEHYRFALEIRTRVAYPVEWAMTHNNLANAYRNRIREDRVENIERAIEHFRHALEIRTREAFPTDWAMTQNNLANAYTERICGDRAKNIERAIAHCECALEVYTRETFPEQWAMAQNNLGSAYFRRICGDRAENLDRVIEHYECALEIRTCETSPLDWAMTQNNLAIAYRTRLLGDRAENVERAIEHHRLALEVRTREAMPDGHRRTQRNLGDLCFQERRWREAGTALQGALLAGDLLYQAATTPEARQAELRETRDLPARLAYALARAPGARHGPLQGAVMALERNRARWLSEALALVGDKPQDVPEQAWQTFLAHRETLQHLQAEARLPEGTPARREYLALSEALRAAYAALGETVAGIRHFAPDFMPDPTFAQTQASVELGRPLVYLAVTQAGTLALIASSSQDPSLHPVWCSLTENVLLKRAFGYTPEEAQRELPNRAIPAGRLGGYAGAYARWRSSPSDRTARAAWFAALDHTCHWLWDALMGPLVEALAGMGVDRAVLIPQGWLGLLPLHAAWTTVQVPGTSEVPGTCRRRYAMDEVCFAYAPNARALLTSQETAARVRPDGLLAVDEPRPVSAGPLPNSAQEVMAACAHFGQPQVLGGEAATAQAVRDQMGAYSVLHLSCHGRAGFAQPLEGGLLLAHDEMLTLREILALRLEDARLAVLSACETGIPGTELPDEVISLPTGLVQAGVAGVVASLWSVSDLSTMMLMARFYDLWKGESLEPPDALRRAQCWVRDTTNGDKAAYFKGFLPEFNGERIPLHVADALYKASVLARPDENDFAHPFYWAAFGYTGA